ncbi:MAG: hypothetical protein K8S98_09115 [Planctomycetes bacterium]|nr:hypothetical protein [Planctomycetota bacterium]
MLAFLRAAAPLALALPVAAQVVVPPVGGVVRLNPLKVLDLELAGEGLSGFPDFHYVRSFEVGRRIWFSIDPTRYPSFVGKNVDVYVVAHKTIPQWVANQTLVDVRGAPQNFTFSAGTMGSNLLLLSAGALNGDAGAGFGVPYDVVIDFNKNGILNSGDGVDGFYGEPGFFVCKDPGQPGPYAVTEIQYSGGSFLGQDTYYPSNIASLGKLPLVVVSHGNGHDYRWYDHIGFHLASWGCIVMSHQNNTGPGIETASVTTLTNTDYILTNQGTINGGVLNGHIDADNIVWIGHSRGGEGVVRAYNKVATGVFVPANYTASDIRLISSIAPTEFLTVGQIDPFDVNYHMFVGASDSDVNGSPQNQIVQSTPIYERCDGNKNYNSIQGAGHADFHNNGGTCWCTGPALIGMPGTHPVMLSNYLALVKHYIEGNVAARDYLERSYDDFHSASIPSNVIVASEHKNALVAPNFVVENYQTQTGTTTSSSGTAVFSNVSNLVEGVMTDLDSSFSWSAGVPMNGMCRGISGDNHRCAVFDWTAPSTYSIDVLPAQTDFSDDDFLSFRACQGTRHPNTDAWNAPLSFGVQLEDVSGFFSPAIDFGEYGKLTRPYPRTGTGTGAGWANEFVSVRIPLEAFTRYTPVFDLTQVVRIHFLFGSIGPSSGRVGLDDIEIIGKGL